MRRLAAGSVSRGKGRWAFFGITEIPDHDDPTQVYLWRLRILETPFAGVKLHHIRMSDNPVTRGLHDHPWSFLSIRLRGNYDELRPGPEFTTRSGPYDAWVGVATGVYRHRSHRFLNLVRSADQHAVRLHGGKPCWTLVLNGPRTREWGFRFPGSEWKPWHQLDGHHARNVRGHAGSTEERRPA